MLEIDVRAVSGAPAERLFALLADARSWPRWTAFDEAEVEQGEGLGEVRRFRTGRVRSRERITGFEPPRRFAYELLSGLPVRDYEAEVTLSPTSAGGTEVRWHSTFQAKVPGTGWMIRRRLGRFIEETAEGLARAGESNVNGSSA
jgi:uncharacterized protein YndB with AHSA1/START domain